MEFNGETIIRWLENFDISRQEMSGFISDSLDIVKDHSDDIFKSEWSNVKNHNKRKQLSASTKTARKNRRWYYKKNPNNPGILRRTGNLQDNTSKNVMWDEGTLKWNADYAKYHLNGANKRVFIELDSGTKADIIRSLQTRIQKKIQAFNNARL